MQLLFGTPALRLFVMLIVVVLLAFLVNELVLPLVFGTRTWPTFRRWKLRRRLMRARSAVEEREITKEIEDLENQLKLKEGDQT